MSTYGDPGYAPRGALAASDTRTVFGQVMGLVALTVGCTALGAYVGRNLTGGVGILFFIAAFACVFGLNIANCRGRGQLPVGLLLGLAAAPVIAYYARADPAALWQAAGATGGFVAALGAGGYATRRDLSVYARFFFWALLALIVFGVVAIFVAIPHANIIYCVLGLVIFGGFTVIDFNRLRNNPNMASAVPIAASIFLDIFNIFLFFLQLFGNRD